MGLSEQNDSIRLIISIPPREYFGGNDRQNALSIVQSLQPFFPHIFLFDCDTYLYSGDADFSAQLNAAKKFHPNVGLALPNSCYGMILDKRASYHKKTLRDRLIFPWHATPLGNVFADELGVPLILPWDHLITHAAQFLIGYPPVERAKSRSGCLDKLRQGLNADHFVHYVPDSGHIEVFERLGICERGFLHRYVVPAHNVFLEASTQPPDGLITDRVLFAGNLNSSKAMSEFGNDPVVEDVTNYVTDIKCKDWEIPAWNAFEKIASQKVAAGIAELQPDHSFFWSLGRELITNVVTTAFRMTVFKSVGSSIDFYGGFTDPNFVAELDRIGLFRSMGSVPLESLGGIYSRYQFSIDITHTPFMEGSNAKVLDCFAAGGFMFIDRKKDLREALGEIAEEFMYRDAEGLTCKMDGLRRCPARRLEIIQTVRERISQDLNLVALLSKTIRQAA